MYPSLAALAQSYTWAGVGDAGNSRVTCCRAAGIATHSYENEVGFCRDLAAMVRIRRPRCYHAAVIPGTADVVVVLEDLAPAAQGDQLTGCDAVDAGLAMTEAARLHGPRSSISVADFYRAVWGGFVDRYRPALAPAEWHQPAGWRDHGWKAAPAG